MKRKTIASTFFVKERKQKFQPLFPSFPHCDGFWLISHLAPFLFEVDDYGHPRCLTSISKQWKKEIDTWLRWDDDEILCGKSRRWKFFLRGKQDGFFIAGLSHKDWEYFQSLVNKFPSWNTVSLSFHSYVIRQLEEMGIEKKEDIYSRLSSLPSIQWDGSFSCTLFQRIVLTVKNLKIITEDNEKERADLWVDFPSTVPCLSKLEMEGGNCIGPLFAKPKGEKIILFPFLHEAIVDICWLCLRDPRMAEEIHYHCPLLRSLRVKKIDTPPLHYFPRSFFTSHIPYLSDKNSPLIIPPNLSHLSLRGCNYGREERITIFKNGASPFFFTTPLRIHSESWNSLSGVKYLELIAIPNLENLLGNLPGFKELTLVIDSMEQYHEVKKGKSENIESWKKIRKIEIFVWGLTPKQDSKVEKEFRSPNVTVNFCSFNFEVD